MAKAIPEEYPRLMPYLIVDGAAEAIEFYRGVFGATERMRLPAPDGRLGHAELQIGEAVVMLADESPSMGIRGPRAVGGTPVTLHIYLEDADAAFERAVQAGAKALRPVENQFYGDRSGQFEDPLRAPLERRDARGGRAGGRDEAAGGRGGGILNGPRPVDLGGARRCVCA